MKPDLSQLRDIHLPNPISWWPLAPGWWGLFALLVVLSALGYWLCRRYQANRWRTHALAECRQIKKLITNGSAELPAQQLAAQQISILLRRVAITRFPRNEVASLSGQNWVNFLTQSVNYKTELESETAKTLLHAPYSPHIENAVSPLLNFAEHWIRALPDKNRWLKVS